MRLPHLRLPAKLKTAISAIIIKSIIIIIIIIIACIIEIVKYKFTIMNLQCFIIMIE